jgi:hypothetical protein
MTQPDDISIFARDAAELLPAEDDVKAPEAFEGAYLVAGFECTEHRVVFGNEVAYSRGIFISEDRANKFLRTKGFRPGAWFSVFPTIILAMPGFIEGGYDLIVTPHRTPGKPVHGGSLALRNLHKAGANPDPLKAFQERTRKAEVSPLSLYNNTWRHTCCFVGQLQTRCFFKHEYEMFTTSTKTRTATRESERIDRHVPNPPVMDVTSIPLSDINP